jgi:chemotaxis protein methyltransferase CheR
MVLSAHLLESFYTVIQSRTGLVLNPHQRSDISALLDSLVASDSITASDLFAQLSVYPLTHTLWRTIVHEITVGETYFFRNQAQFEALRTHILPPLINERRKLGSKHLRLWSAGSATGEEPYSLAILLRELLPDIETWSITLLATDINEEYLEQARNGLYRPHAFRSETPSSLQERWFVAERDSYRLTSSIRSMVLFKPLNLVSDNYPTFESNTMLMDVIFCRNVTIYFEQETTRLIARRFHTALNSNGWLVVGHSEPQSDIYEGFVACNFKDTVVYQKKQAEALPSAGSFPVSELSKVSLQSKPFIHAKKVIELASRKGDPVAPATEDFWLQAKRAADAERWDEARSWLYKAEQKDPFRPEVHYLGGLVALQTGRSELALKLLRRAVYCEPNFVLAHSTLGDVYYQQGARKEAARHWQLALNVIKNSAPQHILPHSDGLTVEMLAALLVDRLVEL